MSDVTVKPDSAIAGAGGGGCFRAGAQIQLQGGKTVAIESLKEGDEVLAFDEQGEIHLAKVTKVHYHADPQPILKVKFWRGETYITPNHWVLNQYGSFVEMGSLTDHDALVDGMGHLRPIIGAELIGHEPVWNLTVEPHHTFICDGVRVHNGGHRERHPVIAGAGGGGKPKGGGGRAAVEADDSLQSRAMVSLLDLLGEGEIGGLVADAQTIFLGDVPLQNADGTYNFNGVSWDYRNGTQDQLPINGFADVETPYVVGTRVKTDLSKTVSITNPNVDSVRVIVTLPALSSQNPENGDINGSSVQYKFQVSKDGGPFTDVNAGYTATPVAATVTPEGTSTSSTAVSVTTTDVGNVGMEMTVKLASTTAPVRTPVSIVLQPQTYVGAAWVDYGRQIAINRSATSGSGSAVGFIKIVTDAVISQLGAGTYYSIEGHSKVRFRVISATHPSTLTIENVKKLDGAPIVTVTGKARSRYQRHHLIKMPKPGSTWQLRMIRISPDSTSAATANETYFDSYVEIVDAMLSYPNSALVGLRIDSAQFNQIPSRSYLVKGLYIRTPSNYDPITRTYTGTWDGTFVYRVSSNPAWILYDLLLHKRYGLGRFIREDQVDKGKLYQIGRYCDEQVPDGFGGMEPRFAINTAIQTLSEAYRLISEISSAFRGMMYWGGSMAAFTQDSPADSSMEFSQANVVDGLFHYTGSSRKDRHSVVLVGWNDPEERFKRKLEYVEDPELIKRYGIRKLETVAFGCTSRGQAARVGRWILYTERDESNLISFKVGIDSALVLPGEIIKIHDQFKSGKRMAGRLVSVTLTSATLDAPLKIAAAGATISIRAADGTFYERSLIQSAGEYTAVSWTSPLPALPVPNAIWMVTEPSLNPVLARVVKVAQDGMSKSTFAISAIEHNPAKYAAIENGLVLERPKTSIVSARPGVVTDLIALTEMVELNPGIFGAQIAVSWAAPSLATNYKIFWRLGSENWKEATSDIPSYDIKNVPVGTYTIKVAATNALGLLGDALTITHTVATSGVSPDVANLRANPDFLGKDLQVAWDALSGAQSYIVQVKTTADVLLREETVITTGYSYSYAKNLNDGGPRRDVKILVKAKTVVGQSANWTTMTFSNPAPGAPTGVTLEAGPGQVGISAIRPADQDLAGMIVWMSSDPTVPMNSGTEIYKGSNNAYMKTGLQPGVAMNFRVAFYDEFGTAALTPSTPFAATPTATGGIVMVTTLPANPAAVDGQTAVFLDVVDANVRGLYGWDGSAWKFTRDGGYLVANSVTADRMNVTNLSSLSANLGTMTAGNITLDASGFIRGGSTGYLTGTGFWVGNHSGTYKLHIGDPTGQYLAWTGSGLTINAGGTFSGALSAASGTFAGSLSAATGSFSGTLSAATGTFSGTLTASAINAVNTINIAGNAVTIPVFAYAAGPTMFYWAGGAYVPMVSAAIDSAGGMIVIQGGFSGPGSYSDSGASNIVVVQRDGVVIYSVGGYSAGPVHFIYSDTPGAGAHTYTLGISANIVNNGSGVPGPVYEKMSLFLLEAKR